MTGLHRPSLWLDQVVADGDDLAPRPPLDGDTEADVVVVGAGLTGLWTAYYLTEADPELRVVIVEKEFAGFGASGRNGGWCSALFPTSAASLAREHGVPAARAMRAAMRDSVVEVGGVAAFEEIDCDFAYGGTLRLARSAAQLERARDEVDDAARWGDDVTLLDAAQARARLRATRVLGATFSPDCARVQPARLARGLARVVAARGVTIAEGTTALRLSPRAVVTDHGTVRARHVVRATEAWTAHLPGSRRAVIPVYSLMIATEPLPAEVWDRIGLARHETFADHRHLVIYGQRTADDRIAFGGAAPRTTGVRASTPRSTRRTGCTPTCAARWWSCSPRSPTPRSRTRGADRSASRATGTPASGSTRAPGWRGRAATSGTGCPRPTSRAARSPTSSRATTPPSPSCRGSTTGRRSGSPSPHGGSGSTQGSCSPARQTPRSG
ncbi:FAD-dependent oxidoreductase [Pengzhenrongella phosphoraccumulans]|uniref:NAD(P)/FAD-dependent oxidoreductase n=1 Tax=Pengzhenrongella phosphoraccumulans TaxID=3114394 RepID=UPI00388F543F